MQGKQEMQHCKSNHGTAATMTFLGANHCFDTGCEAVPRCDKLRILDIAPDPASETARDKHCIPLLYASLWLLLQPSTRLVLVATVKYATCLLFSTFATTCLWQCMAHKFSARIHNSCWKPDKLKQVPYPFWLLHVLPCPSASFAGQ
jgi:hypothetical protein